MSAARRKNPDPLRLPREGSRLRRLYDLMCNGNPVAASPVAGLKALSQLRDFYNCEIRATPDRHASQLLGRWDGNTFVPVERLVQEDAA